MITSSPAQWRSLWISDLHLGDPECNAAALLDFLKHNETETMFLLGDIINNSLLRKSRVLPPTHNDVVQTILRKARRGTRIVFIPSNHDPITRGLLDYVFSSSDIQSDAVHVTADSMRLWVTHGGQFSAAHQAAPRLARLGASVYPWASWLSVAACRLRWHLGLPPWLRISHLKHETNSAACVSSFETILAHEARRQGYDGVVCGHIHQPCIRSVDGILYCNDGDWVKSRSALAEDRDGRLQLLCWPPFAASDDAAPVKTRRHRPIELPALPSALGPAPPPSSEARQG